MAIGGQVQLATTGQFRLSADRENVAPLSAGDCDRSRSTESDESAGRPFEVFEKRLRRLWPVALALEILSRFRNLGEFEEVS